MTFCGILSHYFMKDPSNNVPWLWHVSQAYHKHILWNSSPGLSDLRSGGGFSLLTSSRDRWTTTTVYGLAVSSGNKNMLSISGSKGTTYSWRISSTYLSVTEVLFFNICFQTYTRTHHHRTASKRDPFEKYCDERGALLDVSTLADARLVHVVQTETQQRIVHYSKWQFSNFHRPVKTALVQLNTFWWDENL